MLRLSFQQIQQIIDHARRGAPDEVCGILAGKGKSVSRVLPGKNVAANPRVRYLLEPQQQLDMFKEMEAAGEEMVGIYHSHPRTSAYPSPTDQDMAYYPHSAYLIISLANPLSSVVHAYRLVDGRIEEEEIVWRHTNRQRRRRPAASGQPASARGRAFYRVA
ncbi:MAG: M67 family metallopeptidase [Chloroflexota bacterium]